jgi:hypothetical protein
MATTRQGKKKKSSKPRQVDVWLGDKPVQVNVPLAVVHVEATTIGDTSDRRMVVRVSPDGGCRVRLDGPGCLVVEEHDVSINTPHVSTPEGKVRFIRDLCDSVREALCKRVGDMPADWDGIELRELLAGRFAASTTMMNRKRRRAYKNEVLVRNLDR